jgi:hypothetical protein
MRKCHFCAKINKRITVCRRCFSTYYCDEECAAKDWYQGGAEQHQLHCRRINARRKKYIQRVKKVAEEKVAVREENEEQREEGEGYVENDVEA